MQVIGRAAMKQAAIDIVLRGVDPTGKVVLPPGQRGIRALYERWAKKLGSRVEFSGGAAGWQGCTCPHIVKYSSQKALARMIRHADDFKFTKIDVPSQTIVCFHTACEVHYEKVHQSPMQRLDLFGLTMYLFGLDNFWDAVKLILDEFGIAYKEQEAPLSPAQKRRQRINEALQAVQRLTVEWLQTHPDAAPHRKYLAFERGIADQPVTPEQAADPSFWLNFPRQKIWDELGIGAFIGKGRVRDFLKQNYPDVYEEFVDQQGAGGGGDDQRRDRRVILVFRRKDGSEVDAAYDRIAMWTSYRGEITQVAARAIYEHPVKSKNLGSARHLMGLDQAQRYGEITMVEGQMCFYTFRLLGIENCVCCYGSNGFKDSMIQQVVGAASSGGRGRIVNLALDHDPAGFKATLKIGRKLESAGCEVYVILLPFTWKTKQNGSRVVRSMQGTDFNNILKQSTTREEARQRIEELYSRRITLSQFAVYAAQFEYDGLGSPDSWVAIRDSIRYARAVVPELATVSPAEEAFLVRFWSEILKLPEETTRAHIAWARKHAAPVIAGLEKAKQSGQRILLLAQTEGIGIWAQQFTRLPVMSLPERLNASVLAPLRDLTDRNIIFLADPERIVMARKLLQYLHHSVYGDERGRRQLRVVVVDERPEDQEGFARLVQTGVSYPVFLQMETAPKAGAREAVG